MEKSTGGALVPLGQPVATLFAGKDISPLWPSKQVSLIAGSSGAGKTTILFQLLNAWAQGHWFAGFGGPKGPYGLIAADRTTEAHRALAEHIGLSWAQLKTRSLVDDLNIDLNKLEAAPFPLLLQLLSSVRSELGPAEQPAFMIVDPLMVFLGVDLNKYNLVASKLIQLNRWCLANNTTIVGTHHASKPRSDFSFKRPQDRIAGSGALLAFTSTQGFMAGPDEVDDEQATWNEWTTVSHHHTPITLRLIRNESGLFEPMGLAEEEQTAAFHSPAPGWDPKLAKLSKSALKLLMAMPDGDPINRKIAHILVGASERTADRALDELVDQGLVHKLKQGSYKKVSGS